MAKKTTQQRASFLQSFWLPIILALIGLIGIIAVPYINSSLVNRISATTTTLSTNSFDYQVRVETKAGAPIANVTVIIEIASQAPLNEITDTNGMARIFIDSSKESQPARLVVETPGYKKHVQNIDLRKSILPTVIQLDPTP